jgi:exodeoxyribonuclease VII large subunit
MTLALSSRLANARHRMSILDPRLPAAARMSLQLRAARLDALDRHLQALSPQAVLGRGYTITMLKKSRQILRDSITARPGERLLTRFADGETESIVQDSRQMSLFE